MLHLVVVLPYIVPEGEGVFEYRGDDENGRLVYEGKWKNKAAQAGIHSAL